MKVRDGEFEGLRLAAKASDRAEAARREWPAFEKRLKQLGYGPRAIARAYSTLSGPGTVAEALEGLRAAVPASHPAAGSAAATESRSGPASANGSRSRRRNAPPP